MAEPAKAISMKGAKTSKESLRGRLKRAGGYIRRRGMSEREAQGYKAKKLEYRAKYREEEGRFLTPNQRWLLKWFIILVIVIGILWFTPLASVIRAETGSYFEYAKIGILTQVDKIKSQITGVGEWRNPQATETQEKKGIEIEDVVPTKTVFLSGDKVGVWGSGKIKALEEDTIVKFGCSMDKKPGTVEESKRFKNIYANEGINFRVRCDLEEVNVVETEYKDVEFSAVYTDFKTDAKLRLYTMSEDEKDALDGIDPFVKLKIKDSLLDPKYRTTLSTYNFGPMKVSLSVADRQPLSEGTYTLMIGVDNDKLRWGGELEKLKYDAKTEDWFEDIPGGKWLVDREIQKIEELVAGALKLKFPNGLTPSEKNCKQMYLLKAKDKQTFYCDFKIDKIMEDGLSVADIEANTIYNYEFKDEVSITITPKEA